MIAGTAETRKGILQVRRTTSDTSAVAAEITTRRRRRTRRKETVQGKKITREIAPPKRSTRETVPARESAKSVIIDLLSNIPITPEHTPIITASIFGDIFIVVKMQTSVIRSAISEDSPRQREEWSHQEELMMEVERLRRRNALL